MHADSFPIAKVFANGGDIHYFLPYFQRQYAWQKEQWKTLLQDVIALYEHYIDDTLPEHFMGSLVVINDGTRRGTMTAFKLVDGQQRLITISLMLMAIADLVKNSKELLYRKIRKMVVNPDESGDLFYKLLPTKKYGDQEAYKAILDEREIPKTDSVIPLAYIYIQEEIQRHIAGGNIDPEQLFLVIANSLQVVFIDLSQDERPYEIFESLNAKGKPLSQADLVRNYIAMRLPENRQPEVFERYWSRVESVLREEREVVRLGELTAFIRHYLAFHSGILCSEQQVYERFRDRARNEFETTALFEEEIRTMSRFASYYNHMLRPDTEQDPKIRKALYRLNILEFSTGYPFLLALYDAYDNKKISYENFLEALGVIENYMVRRFLTGEPTNYLNKTFPTLWQSIDLEQFIPSLKKLLAQRKYPADLRVQQSILTQEMYGRDTTRAKTILILTTINEYLSRNTGGSTVLNDEPSVEHIMPQTLTDEWQEDLGENFEQIYQDYLHTLGNLTLVTAEWNSGKLSNKPFLVKKQHLQGHALRLNYEYFGKLIDVWNEQSIRDRAGFLTDKILKIWPQISPVVAVQSSGGAKPTTLIILGQRIPVSTWRDVACQTTESVIRVIDNFDALADAMPAYLSRSPYQSANRQLSNGWYLYLNLSAHSIKNYCRLLIERAGSDDDDWNVEEAS